jgi:trehalose utilization protein
MPVRVTVWGEFRHEKKNKDVARIYPDGMHEAIASSLRKSKDLRVATAHLDQPSHGLTKERLADTDVLTWWGHLAHDEVRDGIVDRVCERVLAGMGLVVLHSGHFSKPFKRLMGTGCNLKWRDQPGEREVLWVTRPGHPIVQGIDDHFVLEREEMYGEFFDVPEPEQTIMISSFAGGEVFRSLMTWTRGAGRVVYFRPGHETFPSYHDPNVLRVIANACRWAAGTPPAKPVTFGERREGWLG